jgi:hypothetical protein
MEHRELQERSVWVLWQWRGELHEARHTELETETEQEAIAQVLSEYGSGAKVLAVLLGDYTKEQTESISEILTRRPRQ